MATRGRKPAPKPLQPGLRRTGPVRPDHLDGWGEEAWDRIVPKLAELGILSDLDGEALALYCATYSRWRHALEAVRVDGVTTYTDKGAVKANPAVAVVNACERLMAAVLVEFGLTPSSRSRVKADERPHDVMADFLARRKR